MKRVGINSYYEEKHNIKTVLEVEGVQESEEVSELMLAILQRVAHEWMVGGMNSQHCYNLFLLAVREAEKTIKEENKNA